MLKHAWIAIGSLLLTAQTVRAESPPIGPCDFAPRRWLDVQLSHRPDQAPRDGLLLSATQEPYTVGGGDAPADAVSVVVQDDMGLTAPGRLEWMRAGADVSHDITRFAWRPETPLAPEARYSVQITLVNRRREGCAEPEPVERSFEITTLAELTPAPPQPPLAAVAHGLAWTSSDNCCVPRDVSRCSRPDVCLECWSWLLQPLIVPVWSVPATAGDPLQYYLFYGTVEAFDMNAYLTSGYTVLPLPLLSTLGNPRIAAAPPQGEACLTAMTRNFRTHAEVYVTRCTDVAEPLTLETLRGVALPPGAVLEPPGDDALTIGPPGCNADADPLYQGEAVQVAASFTSDPQDCIPACGGMFDPALLRGDAGGTGQSGAPAAGAAAGAAATGTGGTGSAAPRRSHEADCAAARPVPSRSHAWLLVLLLCLPLVRVRLRSRRSRRTGQ